MYKIIFYTHWVSVTLFLLIYLVKTILLLSNNQGLDKISKAIKVPEMIVSFLFLITGVYMITQIPVINTFMIIKIIAVLAAIPLAVVGFKKKNKALAIISFLLIVAAYGLAEMSKKRSAMATQVLSNTGAEKIAEPISGVTVFSNNCVSCHGADGKLGLMGAPDLSTSKMDETSIITIIKQGKGAMIGYEAILSQEKINAVAVYVETLKK
ncbi:MAG: cytochrome c [Bacteroidia bacterium]